MKLGVISDIHSNSIALKACLDYMINAGCDEYLFLGDFLTDVSFTKETLELLYEHNRQYKCYMLRGNREEYLLEQRAVQNGNIDGQRWIANSASGNLLYTYEMLTPKDWKFIEELPKTFVYQYEDYPKIRCCHGSPENSRELLQFYEDRFKYYLDEISEPYLLAGHTHFPGKAVYKDKVYINAGCCGISIGDNGYAQALILEAVNDDGNKYWKPNFLLIPYDVDLVVKGMFESGLYNMGHWFINSNIQILLTGVDNAAKLVAMAIELKKKDIGNGEVIWPNIEEKYFEEAAAKIGIPEYYDIFK